MGSNGNSDRLCFGGSKITADGDSSHEIKRCLFLGRKDMTNLDSVFKSRGITLLTKVHLVKAMVFPVVMCGCQSWTIKRAEHRSTDAFVFVFVFFFVCLFWVFFICSEFCHWRRVLRVSWTARRSSQLILKEISPEY